MCVCDKEERHIIIECVCNVQLLPPAQEILLINLNDDSEQVIYIYTIIATIDACLLPKSNNQCLDVHVGIVE